MTIAQAERFYEQDTKKYEVEKNKDFLKWLNGTIDKGYHCFIKIEELQVLIDSIVNWYEIKYPERELEYFEGIRYMNFQDIKKMSDVMSIRQLLYRLPHNQLCLMECGYRAKGWGQQSVYENGKEVGSETLIFMQINRKNMEKRNPFLEKTPYFLLHANHMTGEVINDYELGEYIDNDEKISLDELLSILSEKYIDELDFSELKESVFNHDCDMELRYKILQLVALKLLYSKNTIPERGYERAKRFISEFNKKLGLSLSTKEIDDIINRDYTNDAVNTYVDESSTEKEDNGIKKFIKLFVQ